jgi:SAM-dependent methyltransferase
MASSLMQRKHEQSDPFYVDVLKAAMRSGALESDDRVLVVCGGEKDEASLKSAGLRKFECSNISGAVAVDVENLPYKESEFDAVVVHSGLHHCASPHRGLLEMYRVAKRTLILFEPADSLASRLGQIMGIGQTYEFAAVEDNGRECGGWRNTSIPNWVYRFTASEIRQTINCAHPFGPHRFMFFYRTRIPWVQLNMRRNKIPVLVAAIAWPFLRVADTMGPVFSNNLAAVIRKPHLPEDKFSWLVSDESGYRANASWFDSKFGSRG